MLAEAPKFIGYIRVSSVGQVAGDGPERQYASINSFAVANGLILLACAREDGVSGTVDGMDRPAFTRLIENIEARRESGERLDGIIVERMDRLARDLMVSEMLLKECRERGIKVLCADQGLDNMAEDGMDPTRTLIRQVLGALAQWEKSALVMKLRKARERQKEQNGRCEGQKPMGDKGDEKKVLDFVRSASQFGYSKSKMASEMNAAGLRNRKGGLWNAESVNWIYRQLSKGGPRS